MPGEPLGRGGVVGPRVGMQLLRPGAVGGGDLVARRVARDPELLVEVTERLPQRHGSPLCPRGPAKLPAVTTWDEFEHEAPALAAAVHARLTATLHSILGTVRADGAPRLTGLEVHFGEGELWLAMMPDSRKADDLRRDPRFSVHSAPDVAMVDGDAKVSGRASSSTTRPRSPGSWHRLPMDRRRRAAWRCSGPSSPTPRWPASRTTSWSSTSGAPARRRGRSAASNGRRASGAAGVAGTPENGYDRAVTFRRWWRSRASADRSSASSRSSIALLLAYKSGASSPGGTCPRPSTTPGRSSGSSGRWVCSPRRASRSSSVGSEAALARPQRRTTSSRTSP